MCWEVIGILMIGPFQLTLAVRVNSWRSKNVMEVRDILFSVGLVGKGILFPPAPQARCNHAQWGAVYSKVMYLSLPYMHVR